MTSPDTLLAAIIADPANDDLRMVYADLLDDRGEGERAEFIRLQIKLVDHPKHHTADSGCRFRRRERELLRNHSLKWLEGVPFQCIEFKGEGPIPSVACGLASRQSLDSEFYFERGFVHKVRCTYSDWARHADSITSRCPIERVTLTTEPTCELPELNYGLQLAEFAGKLYPLSQVTEVVHSHKTESIGEALLLLRWPRITFALPAEVAV